MESIRAVNGKLPQIEFDRVTHTNDPRGAKEYAMAGKAHNPTADGKRYELASGIGCTPRFALTQMRAVWKNYHIGSKRQKIQRHVQAFSPKYFHADNPKDVKLCNQLGIYTAKALYPGHQSLVVTQIDTKGKNKYHRKVIHNHILVNMDNYYTGKALNTRQRNFYWVAPHASKVVYDHLPIDEIELPQHTLSNTLALPTITGATAKNRVSHAELSSIQSGRYSWVHDLKQQLNHYKAASYTMNDYLNAIKSNPRISVVTKTRKGRSKRSYKYKLIGLDHYKGGKRKGRHRIHSVTGRKLGSDFDKSGLKSYFKQKYATYENDVRTASAVDKLDSFASSAASSSAIQSVSISESASIDSEAASLVIADSKRNASISASESASAVESDRAESISESSYYAQIIMSSKSVPSSVAKSTNSAVSQYHSAISTESRFISMENYMAALDREEHVNPGDPMANTALYNQRNYAKYRSAMNVDKQLAPTVNAHRAKHYGKVNYHEVSKNPQRPVPATVESVEPVARPQARAVRSVESRPLEYAATISEPQAETSVRQPDVDALEEEVPRISRQVSQQREDVNDQSNDVERVQKAITKVQHIIRRATEAASRFAKSVADRFRSFTNKITRKHRKNKQKKLTHQQWLHSVLAEISRENAKSIKPQLLHSISADDIKNNMKKWHKNIVNYGKRSAASKSAESESSEIAEDQSIGDKITNNNSSAPTIHDPDSDLTP